jgi:pimeloyl-ACP methyl ester carboxylesterase
MTEAAEDRSILTRGQPEPDDQIVFGADPRQVIDVYGGDVQGDALIFIHGGFWRPEHDRAHARPAMAALAQAGFTCFSIEYRREPGRPELMYDDIGAALSALDTLLSDRPTVLIGNSAGGQLALAYAARHPEATWRKVVALAPVADLGLARRLHLGEGAVAAMFGADSTVDAEHDPMRLLAPNCPVTVVHGTSDTRVPYAVAAAYARYAGAELVTLEGVGHFSLIDPEHSCWQTVVAAVSA